MGPWHTLRELTRCLAQDKSFDHTCDIAGDISLDAELLMGYPMG